MCIVFVYLCTAGVGGINNDNYSSVKSLMSCMIGSVVNVVVGVVSVVACDSLCYSRGLPSFTKQPCSSCYTRQ